MWRASAVWPSLPRDFVCLFMKDPDLQQAAQLIGAGGIVAFPTETYYGLAVDPFNQEALARLFRVKQRPDHKPLLMLISELSQLARLVAEVPACLQPLIDLWPAPLTLVFPALPSLPEILTAGTGTVGVRLSPHRLATDLVSLYGGPVTATSANISGQPAACTARQVAQQFGSSLDLIVDGGSCPGGWGSTLVGCRHGKPAILRHGVLTSEELLPHLSRP